MGVVTKVNLPTNRIVEVPIDHALCRGNWLDQQIRLLKGREPSQGWIPAVGADQCRDLTGVLDRS
jgi:hypothetical protein